MSRRAPGRAALALLSAAVVTAGLPAVAAADDITPPTVRITDPVQNPVQTEVRGTRTLVAEASDDTGVAGVRFTLTGGGHPEGVDLGPEDTTAPYTSSWDTKTVADGSYDLRAVARDAAGNTATSDPIHVFVDNGTPPTIRIDSPLDGETLSGTRKLWAFADDDFLGPRVAVQYAVDGRAIGPVLRTVPDELVWDSRTVADGPHTLTATATDPDAWSTTASVRIVVDNSRQPDTTAPTPPVASPRAASGLLGIDWIAASDDRGVQEYQVHNTRFPAADWRSLVQVLPANARHANLAEPGTYLVVALDAAGNATASNTVAVEPHDDGLVAAYGFEEPTGNAAVDASGHGLSGAIAGAKRVAAGRFGSALSFDGACDWVTVGDANPLDLTVGMTVEAWVKPTTLSGWRTVLMKERLGGLAYALYANTNGNRPSVDVVAGRGETEARGPHRLPANAWTHLAATYDGVTLRLYVNGAQVASRALPGALVTSAQALRIGGNAVWGEWFKGAIDEVRIYDRALAPAEVQFDMGKGVAA